MYYNTTDKTTYIYDGGQWNKVASDGASASEGKLDVRYSDDGETFTEENGTIVGNLIGYRIVDENFDSDKELSAEDFEKYAWSEVNNNDFNTVYSIKMRDDKSEVLKFYRNIEEEGSFYEYTPSLLSLQFEENYNNFTNTVKDSCVFKATLIFSDKVTTVTTELLKCNVAEINLSDYKKKLNTQNELVHLQEIEVELYENNIEPLKLLSKKIFYVSFGLEEDMAKFSINASNITAAIDNTKLIFGENGLSIHNGGLSIFNNSEEKVLSADEEGNLNIKGAIESQSGNIGGWIIAPGELYSNNTGMRSDNAIIYNQYAVRFYAGANEGENFKRPFMVTDNGNLYATNAELTGTIHATSGDIKNDFYVGPDPDKNTNGIIIYGGSETEQSYIGSSKFASGAFGTGWKITSDGTADFTNINARGRISSSVFEYSKISSIGGSLYIAPTIYWDSESSKVVKKDGEQLWTAIWQYEGIDLTNSSLCGRKWQIGDRVNLSGILIPSNKEIDNIVATIKALTFDNEISSLTLEFSENILDGTTGEEVFSSGAIMIFQGRIEDNITTRQGIYITAAESNSPYIDIYDNTYSEQFSYQPSVRLGNLAGITNDLFQKEAFKGYGLYSTNAYLTGELILPNAGVTNQTDVAYNGNGEYIEPNAEGTNLIRMWAGNSRPFVGNSVAPFIVTQDGSLYAEKGIFKGEINATSGTFSGVIKAAGIVLKNIEDNISPEKGEEHFFVGYSDNPQSFEDYILNINSNGLSIWEGALQAYSDAASSFENANYTDEIYGYDKENYKEPLPYFYLVDNSSDVSDKGLTLNSRTVAYKNHIFQLSKDKTWKSILLDGGVWFSSGETEKETTTLESKKGIESEAYENIIKNSKNGIYANEGSLCFTTTSDYIFNAGGTGSLKVNTALDMIGATTKATINIGNMKIQEIEFGTSGKVGINFI